MKDVMFDIHSHYEKDGVYYIQTDYGELNTTSKLVYKSAVKDGFIIIKVEDEYSSDNVL